jgi:arabinogalactan endo-1,4-beta-galactosidase
MQIKGLDISLLAELEELGARYYDSAGKLDDFYSIISKSGANTIRLKLWVNPFSEAGEPYGGGTNNFEKTLSLAKRAKDYGMDILLDFHYSDFWADPAKQVKPKSWSNLSAEDLKDTIYIYTRNILKAFREKGIEPKYVQVGNEITNGFLWPEGHFNNLEQFFLLLDSGTRAVRDEGSYKIILHLDFGGDNKLYRKWFDKANQFAIDYDIIGLSYYPFWHGTMSDLQHNLQDISLRYDKDLLVVETSYGFTLKSYSRTPEEESVVIFNEELSKIGGYPPSEEGQAQYLRDLATIIQEVPNRRGMGFIYWAPEWIPVKDSTWATKAGREYIKDDCPGGNSWANMALFDYDGKVLAGLSQFKEL